MLGFAGSLRKSSYNKAILKVALELLPENTELEIFDLEGIPPFNQDLEQDPPVRVRQFKERIRAADALLIATPESKTNCSPPLIMVSIAVPPELRSCSKV